VKRACFISIEGIEGVGKSTALDFLQQYLGECQIEFVRTREPGGTPLAEDIRKVLLGNHIEIMCPDTELLLMFAGRAQNISQIIRPALQRGQWVISDRFTDSSYAYQGGGRGVPVHHITELATWVQGDLQPDITLLLDAPVEVSLKRLKGRGVKDRIEKEGVEFFQRVRQAYLERAKKFPNRIRVIRADQDLALVKQQVLAELEPLLAEASA